MIEFVHHFLFMRGPMKRNTLKSKYQASILGLAIGDALGAAVEFMPPGTFEPVTGFRSGGRFKLDPGQWTDDTSMALCLAESLIECKGFDPEDQMGLYLRWLKDGYLSSTDYCFDIGTTCYRALTDYRFTGEPFSGPTHERSAGNGSLMRLAPIPLFYFNDPEQAIYYACESSRTTHGAMEAIDACQYYAGLIIGALQGQPKEALLSSLYCPLPGLWESDPLAPAIEEVGKGSYKEKEPPEIVGSGYVVKSVEAALWAFYNADSFRDGALLAVNLGNDADTTGAIYGQLAGAFYGMEGIPEEWIAGVYGKDIILSYADRLLEASIAIE